MMETKKMLMMTLKGEVIEMETMDADERVDLMQSLHPVKVMLVKVSATHSKSGHSLKTTLTQAPQNRLQNGSLLNDFAAGLEVVTTRAKMHH